ncbi:TCR/Tet family MFS transporter [Parvibaculum sp.]|uniref:TCR/Tet family MFS transporter n=1 Tax=Parvibaculum sp. TaxID=2024848 RepID=UPI002CE7B237|nr:TCR/Tet family MFS transporter [Parvibaculum sp.]HUD50767.1 TCR/Tet family MFS transporter [Parvibaculum sp.]
MTSARHGRAMAFIFVTVLIDSIGFGIVMPVLPQLIVELSGGTMSTAAIYGGWLAVVYALTQFFCAPIMGSLSDRFGRRPVLLLALLAFSADYALMGFAPTLAWLFVGRFVAGITGATFTPAYAFVADVSAPEDRAKNFGLMGAAFGVGFVVGPVIGGLLGEFGVRAPFFAAAALALLNMIYGYFILPETLPKSNRRAFAWSRANPVGALAHLRTYPVVLGLIGVLFVHYLAHNSLPTIWSFYSTEKFQWSPREIGYSLGAVGLLMAVVQGGLIRVIVPRIGERQAAYAGLSLSALAFFGYAFAPYGWVVYIFMLPGALSGIAFPSIQGLMAGVVPSNTQGELQGGIASVSSITAIASPFLMTQLFGYFTAPGAPVYFPGAAYLAAGLLDVVAALLLLRIIRLKAAKPA